MQKSTNQGGSHEFIETAQSFRHFQALSNELQTPKFLVCAADLRRPAANFSASLSNSNVSYFVGVDAREWEPQMLLTGDRNLTNRSTLRNGILLVGTNDSPTWTRAMHRLQGNAGLGDGSVQHFSDQRFRQFLIDTGVSTNRLALP
jgi:hypothetical protein